jgi:hypothetical protein
VDVGRGLGVGFLRGGYRTHSAVVALDRVLTMNT